MTPSIEAVWRLEARRLTGALLRAGADLALAEDCVQDALVAAMQRWPAEGWPESPGAWLMTAAKHRLIDRMRHAQMAAREQQALGVDADARAAHLAPDPLDLLLADEADEVGDDALRLMFIACHPKLAREAQWVLTLRLVAGLTVAQIARALFAKEATIAQRITRAKAQLAGEPFELPPAFERAARLDAVCTVLYLMFNEGYVASSGAEWMRPTLCHEALRLARHLAALLPTEADAQALQALMELQASRLPARTDALGRPVLLLEQDRRRWDRLLVRRGLAALARCRSLNALRSEGPGTLTLQAELAAVHARATHAEDTDWPHLLRLYDALLALQPSPVVALNRAVALSHAIGPAQALPLVEALPMTGYPWWASARADLLQRLDRIEEAREALRQAIAWTGNERERVLLLERLGRM
ncbi:MAG: sigma-70 family RNA polymerase sigma factor [Polaromonas sp.]|uniref:RNA polymerase sigma factor n=1 Tax=Polaromonas sp. TaxID=1869339 RepID=UPI00181EC24C|nr:sigma-70 family RNA polymerase sigma factor [Polaromonas sp.]NMM11691.1 sigma-70 family RNA polymerase sigma factor [Polaromonas sp.]